MKTAALCALLLTVIILSSNESRGQVRPNTSTPAGSLFPFMSSTNGKMGYINSSGREVIKPQFDNPCFHKHPESCLEETPSKFRFSQGFAKVLLDEKYGYIDESGQIRIKPQFEEAGRFSEGLAAVKIGGKYGYIDVTGNQVIKPKYDDAGDFSDGLARVKVGGKYGYIDREQKMVIEPKFYEAGDFSQGLASVRIELYGKYGYINKYGEIVIGAQFDGAGIFSEGLAKVSINNQYGFIDNKGAFAMKPNYWHASDFSDGLAFVGNSRESMYINTKGEKVFSVAGESGNTFINGLALVYVKTRQVHEEDVDIRDPITIGGPGNQRNRYIKVTLIISYGYINKQGQFVFRDAMPFDALIPFHASPASEHYSETRLVEVTIVTNPAGAKVYLVPQAALDDDGNIINDDDRLSAFEKETDTPYKNKVYSQVYVVVVKLNGKKVKKPLDVNGHKDNTVEIDFNKEK